MSKKKFIPLFKALAKKDENFEIFVKEMLEKDYKFIRRKVQFYQKE